jgi:hypothetical protein
LLFSEYYLRKSFNGVTFPQRAEDYGEVSYVNMRQNMKNNTRHNQSGKTTNQASEDVGVTQ